jgi:hypothetical protein
MTAANAPPSPESGRQRPAISYGNAPPSSRKHRQRPRHHPPQTPLSGASGTAPRTRCAGAPPRSRRAHTLLDYVSRPLSPQV